MGCTIITPLHCNQPIKLVYKQNLNSHLELTFKRCLSQTGMGKFNVALTLNIYVFGQVLLVSDLKMLVNCKRPLHVSGKITTVPRLFSEYLPQMENKHQLDYECTH